MSKARTLAVDRGPAGAWIGGILAAAAGVWVFRGALTLFFAADDFGGLARASGLLPRLQGAWRVLAAQTFFDVMRPVAGLDPRPYHAACLLLHAACAALLFALLRRRLSTPAALVGAACFATHPAHFTAVSWVSCVGSPLSGVLALGVLHAAWRRDRVRWLALPLFAAALLAKEAVVLLPLALWALLAWEARESAPGAAPLRRDPLLVALALLGAADIAYLAVADLLGARAGSVAYAPGTLPGLLANVLTYTGWTANLCILTVRHYQDAVDPLVYAWGAGLLAVWAAGFLDPGLRRRGWSVGGELYLACLLPVLPLGHHTYHYYLYASLLGFGWCVGAAADLLLERWSGAEGERAGAGRIPAAGSRAGGWIVALALVALLTANGALLTRKIESMPMPISPVLHADATVDRTTIARSAIASLAGSAPPRGSRLLFWSPIARSLARDSGPGESYFEANVRAALFDGLAVRLFFPQVDSVAFVTSYAPRPEPWRYAVYRPDGRLRLATSAQLDSLLSHSGTPR
jgi:hypothetical protein